MNPFPPFRPLPLLGNPHVQTVLGNLFKGPAPRRAPKLHVVPLPDGDALALHDSCPADWRHGLPVALLVHGLGGCHQSGYMRRVTRALNQHAVRVLRLDLRGVGAGVRLARKVYNAASSADVRRVLDFGQELAPGSPWWLVGFSLGGNISLKLLGEAAAQPIPHLQAAASVNAPIDLALCSALIKKYPFYDRFFVKNMVKQWQEHLRHFPEDPTPRFARDLTLEGIDEQMTAPRGGFASAQDYYRRASARPHIPQIQVPTLLLAARDDPFIAMEPYEDLPHLPQVRVHLEARGGHLGFLDWHGLFGPRWAERQLVHWLLGFMKTP